MAPNFSNYLHNFNAILCRKQCFWAGKIINNLEFREPLGAVGFGELSCGLVLGGASLHSLWLCKAEWKGCVATLEGGRGGMKLSGGNEGSEFP